MKFNLTKKIISFYIFSIVFVVVLVTSVAYFYLQNITKNEINTRLDVISLMKTNIVKQFIEIHTTEAKNVVDSMHTKDLLINLLDSKKRDRKRNFLKVIQDGMINMSDVVDLSVLDKNGTIIDSINKQEIGKIKAEDLEFLKAKNDIYLSGFNFDITFQQIVLKVLVPIKDSNNNLLGVFVEKINNLEINKLMTDRGGLGLTGETFLINEAHFATTDLLKEKNATFRRTIYLSQIDSCLKKNSNYFSELDYNNDLVFGYAFWFPEINSCLITKIDQSEAFSILNNTMTRIILINSFICLFAAFISYFISKIIIKPLRILRNQVIKVKEGNLDVFIESTSKDEIGDLAISFREMLFALNQLYKNLDKKVKERTQKIEESEKKLEEKNKAILNVLEDVQKNKNIIAREKEKMDAILHSIGDGVFVVDKNLKVILVNKVAAKMTGYKMEEILGAKYTEKFEFLFEDTGKVNSQFIDEVIETKVAVEMSNHTILINKDGNKTQVADSSAPLLDDSGNIIGVVVVFRDVTKEREIDKAKTEFVSLASHQLRTPLSSINWYTEMLLTGDVGEMNKDQKKYLEEIANESKRMVDLVSSLLNVSRLELNTFIVDPEPTNIIEMARSVLSELKPQIVEKKLKVEELYNESIQEFQVDKKLLRIIFQNLLSNAVKYTPNEGVIKIELSVMLKGENFGGKEIKEDSIAIKISDTGMGIPDNQKDKIFLKLFRADNVRETEIEGTGLGLYIVKSIVDHSDGLVWFESKINEETKFYVTFPLAGMKRKDGTKTLN